MEGQKGNIVVLLAGNSAIIWPQKLAALELDIVPRADGQLAWNSKRTN